MRLRSALAFALLCLSATFHVVAQQIAPDASLPGPLPVATGEYALGAQIDNLILPGCQPRAGYDCKIEVRAEVYRPQTLSGTYPVVIFLHGNHGTCGRPYQSPPDPPGMLGNPRIDDSTAYTGTGTCPSNYIESPSYEGYEYLANRLASYGYIVVSIDANRGITGGPGLGSDTGLIKARGILILRHLQNLSRWNRHGVTPPSVGVNLQGHLDFTNIGLMGHSRGGDGVRAAYNDYIAAGSIWPGMIEDPVTFKGIFEIAPVDFLGNNSKGVPWNIIAGMCDGDVSDLQGIHPYDRDILPPFESQQTQKSTFVVWGANHDFFNTQWQVSDGTVLSPPNFPSICTGTGNNPIFTMSPGSAQQRLTTISALLAFFRANVGNATEPDFNRNFNPWWGIPPTVTDENGAVQPYPTRADRGFTPPVPITVFEDFTGSTGTSSYGFPNQSSNITISHGRVPNHDSSLRGGAISWTTAGPNTFFQTNWTAAGSGTNISSYTTLELRVSRQNNSLNASTPTDFTIRLMGAAGVGGIGSMSGSLKLSTYIDPNFAGTSGHQSYLTRPGGIDRRRPAPHSADRAHSSGRFSRLAAGEPQRSRHSPDVRPDRTGRHLRRQHPAVDFASESGGASRHRGPGGGVAAIRSARRAIRAAAHRRHHCREPSAVAVAAQRSPRGGNRNHQSRYLPRPRQPANAEYRLSLLHHQPLCHGRFASRGLFADGGRVRFAAGGSCGNRAIRREDQGRYLELWEVELARPWRQNVKAIQFAEKLSGRPSSGRAAPFDCAQGRLSAPRQSPLFVVIPRRLQPPRDLLFDFFSNLHNHAPELRPVKVQQEI